MNGLSRTIALILVLVAAGAAAMAQVWEDLTPAAGPAPAPRTKASAIYDPVGNRMIVFGGQGASGRLNDSWSFDVVTHAWTDITPATNLPPARLTPNTVYDAVGHEMLLWAGQGVGSFLNDVWSFDLDNEAWTEFTPPEPRPNLRYGTASVFDPVERELVTFAGFTFVGRFDDTWRFDPETDTWTDVSPAVAPQERCLHSSSHDLRGHRMIIYSGQSTSPVDDIWALDLATDTWTDLTPVERPPGRWFTAQAYDSARHQVLIFGGGSGFFDEVWSFDLESETWNEIVPALPGPSGREGATGVYVPTQDRMIVFGGEQGVNNKLNDVWALRFSDAGGVVFPGPILADADAFHWIVPVNIDFVRGDLTQVAILGVDLSASLIHATSFAAVEDPEPGQGFYYLARVQGSDGSWQSVLGNEQPRDVTLP